jgi:hypothetical protein
MLGAHTSNNSSQADVPHCNGRRADGSAAVAGTQVAAVAVDYSALLTQYKHTVATAVIAFKPQQAQLSTRAQP